MPHPRLSCRLATALLTLTTLSAHATDIEWQPSWKANDQATYEVKRCRKANGPRPVDACATSQIEILILRADGQGSVQRWKTAALGEGLAGMGLPPEMASVMDKASRTAMDIEFNESVRPVRLINAQEVRSVLESVTGALTASSLMKADPRLAATVKAMMSQLVSTDDKLLALSTKDPGILYSPLGGRFSVGRTVRTRSSMLSPFGSTPIESTVSITTEAKDTTSREVALTVDEDIDREAFASTV
ncbi:MAG: hypothetical protein EOP36_16485 [Rubrivivax sp.]|nr:MAG: hypothetical protein EOP36_16485 [Rubrivivax sp.]